MRCPYCYGPISRVRGLGKSQPEDKDRTFYRCLLCGADFSVAQELSPAKSSREINSRRPALQLVWPRAAR
jgi:hypothetical protein